MDARQLREAIALARSGRAEGYEAILDAFGRRLYGYFLRATASHHDAEDLLGELMVRLVRHLKSYSEQGRFEHWLFRIAANLVRDRILRIKARPTALSLSTEDSTGRTRADRLDGDYPPPDNAAMAADVSEKLNAALAELDEKTRQMILLRHFGEMRYKQIAELTGCPLGTVLARVHRGLGKLRQAMDANDGTE